MIRSIRFAIVLLTAFSFLYAQSKPASNKVPDEFAVRILKISRDKINLQTRMLQLQQQYQGLQQAYDHDNTELSQVKTEALKAMNRDPKEWDIDEDKVEAVAKPAPPPAAKK